MRKLYGQNLKKLQQVDLALNWFKISHHVFAERADEIFRKLITFVNISAHLAYEAFLAFRCRLRFYIVLIVVVGHGLDFGDHAGLGNAADEHSVGVHVNVLLYFQRHEGVNVFWQESKSVVRVQRLDASTCKLITVLPLWNPKVWKMSNGASVDRQFRFMIPVCLITWWE